MDEARELEGHAVAAFKEHGDRRGPGSSQEHSHRTVPSRVSDATLFDLQMRHRPGRENAKSAPLRQPPHRETQLGRIVLDRPGAAQHVDGQNPGAKLRNAVEHFIGQ